jgi:hypothetical protein
VDNSIREAILLLYSADKAGQSFDETILAFEQYVRAPIQPLAGPMPISRSRARATAPRGRRLTATRPAETTRNFTAQFNLRTFYKNS